MLPCQDKCPLEALSALVGSTIDFNTRVRDSGKYASLNIALAAEAICLAKKWTP